MQHHLIDIDIHNGFRAIKEAHVHIDGISVISGINGSGKSTISKLLYTTFKNALQYENIVVDIINEKLMPYSDALTQMQMQMSSSTTASRRHLYRWRLRNKEKKSSYLTRVREFCDRFIKEVEESHDADTMMSERMWRILYGAVNEQITDLPVLLDKLQQLISKALDEGFLLLAERPRDILNIRMSRQFGQVVDDFVRISEYGDAFIGANEGKVPLPHYIQQVVYIDTPMILGLDLFDAPEYWTDLYDLLRNPANVDFDNHIFKLLQTEIMHGEAQYDEEAADEFIFKREDGQTFELFKCATGIKSFSILQLLLKNGTLGNNTLLIIDEPEAHLHPQWIIEYARMVLLLHKRLGVKFLIASHSTDFVGAIKEISAATDVKDINFYLAEETDYMQYKYCDLGFEIEPIFASFNKSFEKLDNYAKPEEL